MAADPKYINIPLNVSEFFLHLMPGLFFLLLFIIDYDLVAILNGLNNSNHKFIFEELNEFVTFKGFQESKIISFIFLILFCYIIGYLLSAVSSILLEKFVVRRYYKYPSFNLFNTKVCPDKKKKDYYRPLDPNFLREFEKVFYKRFKLQIRNERDELVLDPDISFRLSQMDVFQSFPEAALEFHYTQNSYSFSRNISSSVVVFLFLRIALLIAANYNSEFDYSFLNLVFELSFVIISWVMFKNYLRAFKRRR